MNPRAAILAEMGLSPAWVRREAPPVARGAGEKADGEKMAVKAMAEEKPPPAAGNPARRAPPPPMPAAPEREERKEQKGGAPEKADRPSGVAGMGWEELRRSILDCRACGLCEKRTQAVPGVGDENAAWLFVGEGPGAEEDARGEPFVGQAGRLLDAMLAAIGLERGRDVYIANAVKCRPPGNRTPENAEMAACFPYLKRQIALIRPRLIVLLGRAAVNAVLRHEGSLSSLRGRTLVYRDGDEEIPTLVTYHPAYLLRNLPDKSKAWEDLCRARALMRTLGER
ncbi:MAG: uracil-DNA glycosylase [Candidatus Accumulibacter sp.]|jgi:DNA polymerase|nr:uracil-DNA glycosylase [Accumulibacter sp.]